MSHHKSAARDSESLNLLSGLIGEPAAKQLWNRYGSLTEIGRQPPRKLQAVSKTTLRKITQLLSSFKLAASLSQEQTLSQRPELNSSKAIAEVFREKFRLSVSEELHVAVVDQGKRLIDTAKLTPEGVSQPRISKAAVFAPAIEHDGSAIILAHNYPRSHCSPTEDDINFSRKVCAVGNALEIPVLDHVIFGQQKAPGKKDYSSLYDLHLIGPK